MPYSIRTVILTNTPGAINSINVSNEPIIKGIKGEVGPIGPQGPTGPQGPLKTINTQIITLTSTIISNKGFALQAAPIELIPIGGVPQIYGVDYTYSNGIVSWDGLGLDNFLELNEQVIVKY